jgi:hypothetical protein
MFSPLSVRGCVKTGSGIASFIRALRFSLEQFLLASSPIEQSLSSKASVEQSLAGSSCQIRHCRVTIGCLCKSSAPIAVNCNK